MTTDTPSPLRKWLLKRWFLLLWAGFFAYCGWRIYADSAFYAVRKEARALGWDVFDDPRPSQRIPRKNWKSAFERETWSNGHVHIGIWPSDEFEQHLAILHRLNPKALHIDNAAALRDLSALNGLTRLEDFIVANGPNLTNVDALKNLPALQYVRLNDCKALTNVDGLKSLSALQYVNLDGCTGLTKESVASLKAALPNTQITGP